jgi:DNA-binding response OmpR family regulator
MNKVHLLIANSIPGLSNRIESLVLEVCFDQAAVETTRIARAEELVKLASSGAYQLVIVATDNLLPPPSWRKSWVSADEAVRAIHAIRGRCDTPVIAVSIFPRDEGALWEAGVECMVRLPFEVEKLKLAVRRVLRMADPVEESKPTRSSLTELVPRGFGTALVQAMKSIGSIS